MNRFKTGVEPISIEGFQVVSGEFFSHANNYITPSCKIWSSEITFDRLALAALNCCVRIGLEVHPQMKSLLVVLVVMREVYYGKRSPEISSYKLCKILTELHGWDPAGSYRVPGKIEMSARSALFSLDKAEVTGNRKYSCIYQGLTPPLLCR